MHTRTEVINYYLDNFVKHTPKHYLEIGVCRVASNLNHIRADVKDGVDPDQYSGANYLMTSDAFFAANRNKYDVIFIDGLHQHHQVYRDVINSLNSLKSGGFVVMHDCNPNCEYVQTEEYHGGAWTGTTWKAFVQLRRERDDLEMFVIDIDWGVGIIDPSGKQKKFECGDDIYDYNVFAKCKKEALNLITPTEFESRKGYSH